MNIIAVANAAGSAGKTTTVVTLAALLAEAGQRVVVVDLDGQANATRWLGVDPRTLAHTVGDVLLDECSVVEALVETNTQGVRLLPANSSVNGDALELRDAVGREMRVKTAIRDLCDVDVVLIDCPGTIGLMTVMALVAADAALTVAQPSMKELEGIEELEKTISEVRKFFGADVSLRGVVPCIVPPASAGRLYANSVELARDTYDDLVLPPVRRSVKAAEAYAFAQPLPLFAPREGVTEDYRGVLGRLQATGVL
ncbi:hypothetical protein HX89_14290 (plasmid) [Dermacoccus nishinomiyaensis]|uniref:AAA domain-containing protein n=2 Tax=Dermacoccus nishinomiyaensis TaxID=1274 RepID=A0A075JIC1_9MICO|nr:ParA family protein [Dermacoccus nishinomiyaensis]AIF41876.1 hypothetical protein HX89_14290 [Dermacoccus nishinomiyaensis]